MAYTKKTWVSGETPCSSENFNHMEQGIADAHNKLDELNTKINAKTTKYAYETLTCQAEVVREYTFQGLPQHVTSIPVIGGATKDAFGSYVIRDFSTTGKVRIYSPITQDVVVYLILFM